MDILGIHIGGLVFWQIAATGAIITLYAMAVVSDHRRLARESFGGLVIMASFVLKHGAAADIPELMRPLGTGADVRLGYAEGLQERVETFRETGELDQTKPADSWDAVVRIVFAVAMAFIGPLLQAVTPFFRWRQRRRLDLFAAVPTQFRRHRFATTFVSFAVSLGYVALWAYVGANTGSGLTSAVADALAVFAAVLAVSAVADALLLIRAQTRWKEFWEAQLLDIMGRAERNDDHDLFNRASLLRSDVRAEPDVPIPGTTGFYTGLFAVVQIALLWWSENLA